MCHENPKCILMPQKQGWASEKLEAEVGFPPPPMAELLESPSRKFQPPPSHHQVGSESKQKSKKFLMDVDEQKKKKKLHQRIIPLNKDKIPKAKPMKSQI